MPTYDDSAGLLVDLHIRIDCVGPPVDHEPGRLINFRPAAGSIPNVFSGLRPGEQRFEELLAMPRSDAA